MLTGAKEVGCLVPPRSKRGDEIERMPSGLDELDSLIGGGYPKGKTTLLTGGPGTGKTIMAMHFVHHACKSGHKCLYYSSEESLDEIRLHSKQLKMPVEDFEASGLLKIYPALNERMKEVEWRRGKPANSNIFKQPIDTVASSDASVIVIDNIGSYSVDVTLGRFREQIDYLIHKLREKCMTGLVICDETVDARYNGVALYSVYGAIHMMKRENPFTGNMERLMNVVKMRGTKTPLDYVKYNIEDSGIKIVK